MKWLKRCNFGGPIFISSSCKSEFTTVLIVTSYCLLLYARSGLIPALDIKPDLAYKSRQYEVTILL